MQAVAPPAGPLPQRLTCGAYRLGAFLLLHVIDEPAWLALLFC